MEKKPGAVPCSGAEKARSLWERFGAASVFLKRHELPLLTRFWYALRRFLFLSVLAVVRYADQRRNLKSLFSNK